MAERVFVTGASGFVGSAVVAELVKRGFGVTALVNRTEVPSNGGDVQSVRADLFDEAAMDAAVAGCRVVIHLVGIIMEKPKDGITFRRLHVEATTSAIEAAKRNNIRRYIHMSALGTRAGAVSEYHKSKWEAEEIVRGSGLDWTIFRPSMIHGPRGEFMRMEAKWARKQSPPFLFMPYFGRGLLGTGGAGKLQPIFVGDVARGFVEAIGNQKSIGKAYAMAGTDVLTWPGMHEIVARTVAGKKRLALGIPAWYAKLLTKVAPASALPFNADQVVMSQEDNTADIADFERDFGWKPARFEESLRRYAAEL
jgi:NADH dehydrogenase